MKLIGRLRAMASGYGSHGASFARKSLMGWMATAGGPDEDITEHVETLRERSRDLFAGTPLATGALRTLVTNTVGAGLRLSPSIDAEALGLSDDEADAWERQTAREFALWSKHADAARTATWEQLQSLALLSALMSGDVFVALPTIRRGGSIYDLRVQLIEADRVCDPSPVKPGVDVCGGVELGKYGEPVAYYVAQNHPGSTRSLKMQSWKRVPAFGARTGRRNMLHILAQERPEQRRGVPILAPVIESLKQLGRYSDAELMAAVVSAMLTVFVKSDAPDPMAGLGAGIPAADRVDDDDASTMELGNGSIVGLAPGESIDTVAMNRPNAAFDGFVRAICVPIGTALEIPYELLLKHFTGSYTAARAALNEFWKSVRAKRAWIVDDFCQPIYDEWLAEAVARGRVVAPGFFEDLALRSAWSGAKWYGPAQGQINPRVEVAAAAARVDAGFSTATRETAELTGERWEDVNRIRAREIAQQAMPPQETA